MRAGPSPVVCGLLPDGSEPLTREPEEWEPPRCPELLWWTHRPASSLWCPVHGHVLDVPPPRPLGRFGVLFLCGREAVG